MLISDHDILLGLGVVAAACLISAYLRGFIGAMINDLRRHISARRANN